MPKRVRSTSPQRTAEPGRIEAAKLPGTDLVPLSALPANLRKISEASVAAATNSYCPYSGFGVGAALLHPDGEITVGCNWENCVYQGVCAERSAIVAANAVGRRQVTAVAVWGAPQDKKAKVPPDTLVTPCGICRQMLNEVGTLSQVDLDIVLVNNAGTKAKVVKLSTLLPADFGPKDIGFDLSKWAFGAADSKGTTKKAGKK